MILYQKDVVKDQFKNKRKFRIIIHCCIVVFVVIAVGYTLVDYKENNIFNFHPVLFIGVIHCIFLVMMINGKWYYRNNIAVTNNNITFCQTNFFKPKQITWSNIIKVSVTYTSVKFYTTSKNLIYHFNQFTIDDVRALKNSLQQVCEEKNIEFIGK